MNSRMLRLITPSCEMVRQLYPGVALCVVIALAGSFLAQHYAVPALMLVLLLGLGFSAQAGDIRLQAGVALCSRQILRVGVALLGARIGMEQLASVGKLPLLLVMCSVPLAVTGALVLGRLLGLSTLHSLVAGAAVGICGVSAAMAVAAVIPPGRLDERKLVGIAVGTTALGTLSMLLYPPLLSHLGYDDTGSGLVLGASIHDVAQAAGAGYLVSTKAGDIATLTKLLRVALLAPLVLLLGMLFRPRENNRAALPWFLLGFVALFGLNSLGWLPEHLRLLLVSTSNACLLLTMAALGMRTTLGELLAQGWRPMLLLVLLSSGLLLGTMALLALMTDMQ